MSTESQAYASLGASSSKQGILAAVGEGAFSQYFCKPIPDVGGDPEYFSFLHADGVGTKAIVAYIVFRETGDPSVFRSLAQDSLVMNLDDLACVGAFEGLTLSNTIGRNTFTIPDTIIEEIVAGYRDVAQCVELLGLPITLAGGETADLSDLVRTIVIDSTLHGRVRRKQVIQASSVAAGDVIVGLSSTGQASYEKSENSGLGSNGFTLARHALIAKEYAEKYPEIQEERVGRDQAYCGKSLLFDKVPYSEMTVAQALLSPTRTYAPIIKGVLEKLGEKLHSCIHCSGGGQTKVLRFGKGLHFIKDNLFPTPPVMRLIQQSLNVPWQEMYSVFNMGHRMELYCSEADVRSVIEVSESFGIAAQVVGRVEKAKGDASLSIVSEHGEHQYSL